MQLQQYLFMQLQDFYLKPLISFLTGRLTDYFMSLNYVYLKINSNIENAFLRLSITRGSLFENFRKCFECQ